MLKYPEKLSSDYRKEVMKTQTIVALIPCYKLILRENEEVYLDHIKIFKPTIITLSCIIVR